MHSSRTRTIRFNCHLYAEGCLTKGSLPRGVSARGGVPGGCLSTVVSAWWGVCIGGGVQGVSVQEGVHPSRPTGRHSTRPRSRHPVGSKGRHLLDRHSLPHCMLRCTPPAYYMLGYTIPAIVCWDTPPPLLWTE